MMIKDLLQNTGAGEVRIHGGEREGGAQGVEQVWARITRLQEGLNNVEYLWRSEAEHQESKTGGTNARTRMRATQQ